MSDSKKKQKRLIDEVAEMLRDKNRQLELEVSALKTHLREAENNALRVESRVVRAEEERQALYDAVRVLAGQVSNTMASGRRARHEARKTLENHKIRPPSTLGSSRAQKRKTRRKKKNT